jgi:hypothetical protein
MFFCLVLTLCLVFGLVSMAGAEKIPNAELPVIIVSAGQSSGIFVATAIANKCKLPYDMADVPTVKNIRAGVGLGGLEDGPGVHVEYKSKAAKGKPYNTMILVLGASLKGMGASGLSLDDEVARLKSLVNYCRKNDIKIVALHVEGESKRGKPGSDNEMVIDAVAPRADYLIVTSSGNKDGKFTNIAKKNNIPISVVDKTMEISQIFETMFKLKK